MGERRNIRVIVDELQSGISMTTYIPRRERGTEEEERTGKLVLATLLGI